MTGFIPGINEASNIDDANSCKAPLYTTTDIMHHFLAAYVVKNDYRRMYREGMVMLESSLSI